MQANPSIMHVSRDQAKPYGEYFAGWYYHAMGNDLHALEDVFRERWDSTVGPLRADIIGPFPTAGAALADMQTAEDLIVIFPDPDAMQKALAVYDLEARPLDTYPGYTLPGGWGGRSVRLFGGPDCRRVKSLLAKWKDRGAKY